MSGVPGAGAQVSANGHPAVIPGYGEHQQQQPGIQSYNQTAEFFLSNYRLGKTLGIGSFGKVEKHSSPLILSG